MSFVEIIITTTEIFLKRFLLSFLNRDKAVINISFLKHDFVTLFGWIKMVPVEFFADP